MKKLAVFLALSLVLCMLLAACAPAAPTTSSSPAATQKPTTKPTTTPTQAPPIPTDPKPTETDPKPTTTVPMPTDPKPTEPQPTEPILPEPVFEAVVSSPDFLAAIVLAGGEKQKPAEDLTIGKFTFGKGCYFESSNDKYFTELPGNVNTQKKDITVVLEGITNAMKFDARGASGGGCVITIFKEGVDEAIYTSENLESGTLKENIELKDLEPGTYVIKTSGSARIGDFTITERMEKAEPVSIEVKALNTKVLLGRPVSTDSITVELVYANGRRDVLTASDYSTNAAALDMRKAGKYSITVTHRASGFSDSYEIFVYAVDSIRISDHSLDSKRVTHPVQKIYLSGSSYDNYANAAVIATCSAPGVDGTEEFVLKEGEYNFTPASESNKQITATVNAAICSGEAATAGYAVEILSLSDSVNKHRIIVDANGTVGQGSDGVITVKSINDALKLFELLGTPAEYAKTIILCAGTYNEKVDISVPNLSVVAKKGTKAEDIVVVYNALNGISDPSGTTGYSTDGSATFSLRAEAENFYARGFTIMNYYNNHARYEASKLIAGSGTQAVALLVRADKAIFEDMQLSSYQDTLYAENGRQIYRNCYIEGRTDYIFGNNATAYFEGCTIRSIYGADDKNGGYVITTKGGDSAKHVEYGFIFNKCTFEGEENVAPGSVSIARGWDKYMTIMVMNSSIDDEFSLEAYGDSSSNKNDRYTKMNADPVAAQIYEYNNTGAGALTQDMIASAVDGLIEKLCTVPSAERAADFADFAKIFAAKNGSFSYSDDWMPEQEADMPEGNQIGQRCYGAELEIVNHLDVTGETINPVTTGKVTIINFWGTWCSPCVKEMVDLDKIATDYADTVTVVAVHSYAQRNNVPNFIYYNGYEDSKIIFSRDYAEEGYYTKLGFERYWPSTAILDENGVICYTVVGAMPYENFKSVIDSILEK